MPSLVIRDQQPLAELTSLELGGPAEHFTVIDDRAQLFDALDWAAQKAQAITILGGGSNVIVSDRGVPGLVLRMQTHGIEITATSELIAQAGEAWDGVVARSVDEGLAGLECLSGIPGQVGATPIQNVGAYGQEIANCLRAVEVLDRSTRQIAWLAAEDCEFAYRTSRFKREPDRHVVLAVRFGLARAPAATPRYPELANALAAISGSPSLDHVRAAVLALRRAKSMLIETDDENRRSVGSFFLNPIVTALQADDVAMRARSLGLIGSNDAMPRYPQARGRQKLSAAWLIEKSGTRKGERVGGVGISTRHSLALVHHGGASTADLVEFAEAIRARVRNAFQIELVPEPVPLGFSRAPF
ncbi:MAG TPA: UDP-N-acetylmuramate dehydrogenase [Polyangiales bacterium]|nr:UDP-N-acetylmuramate dehydrogenase [Polyangiales bacterium]